MPLPAVPAVAVGAALVVGAIVVLSVGFKRALRVETKYAKVSYDEQALIGLRGRR